VLMYGAISQALDNRGEAAIAMAKEAAGRFRSVGKPPHWSFLRAADWVRRFDHPLAPAASRLVETFDRECYTGSAERTAQALETFIKEVRAWMERQQ
jgi:hypothetical protein